MSWCRSFTYLSCSERPTSLRLTTVFLHFCVSVLNLSFIKVNFLLVSFIGYFLSDFSWQFLKMRIKFQNSWTLERDENMHQNIAVLIILSVLFQMTVALIEAIFRFWRVCFIMERKLSANFRKSKISVSTKDYLRVWRTYIRWRRMWVTCKVEETM